MDAERPFPPVDTCRQFSEVNADQHFHTADSNRQYSPLNSDQQFVQADNNRQFSSLNNNQQFAPADNNGQFSSLNTDQQFRPVDGSGQFSSVNSNQQFSGEETRNFSHVDVNKQYPQLNINEQFNHVKSNEQFTEADRPFVPPLNTNNHFAQLGTDIESNRHFQSSDFNKQFSHVGTEINSHFPPVKTEGHFQPVDSEHIPTDVRNYCTTELIDEETNNGPLDFSLHRAHDLNVKMEIIPLEESGVTAPCRPKVPRVKLTLRETTDQREKRLKEGRDRMRRLRSNENNDERDVRLQKARECQERRRQRERVLESQDERERRLSVARERTRLRRAQESPNQRERRLKSTRDRLRMKRSCETSEERQRRLQHMRDRKQGKPSDDKDFTRRRKRRIKFDQDVERRQTRGISIKYDTFEDDLDEALFHLHNAEQSGYADGGALPWVTEPEVCLSVDTSQKTISDPPPSQVQNPVAGNPPAVPPPQDLRDQISQHVSNLVLKTDSPPPNSENCPPPKSHKQKIKIYYRKNHAACHQDPQTDSPSTKNPSAHKPEFDSPKLPYKEDDSSAKNEVPRESNLESNYPSMTPVQISQQTSTPFRNSQEAYTQPANNYSYSSHASSQIVHPPPPLPVTEGSTFPQQGSETPLNLHQGSYMYPRYTPPPPYEPPNGATSAYTASYNVYSQPPMEGAVENTESEHTTREASDNTK